AGGPAGGAGFEDLLGGLFGQGGGPRSPGGSRFGTPGASAGGAGFEDLLGGLFGQAGGGGFGGGGSGFGSGGFGSPGAPTRGQDLEASARVSFRDSLDGSTVSLRVPDPRGGPSRAISARLPQGVRDGQKVRLRGKGMPGPGGANGDLLVTVHVEPHPVFRRDGDDLRMALPVSFDEAVLGATVDVPTLDGSNVRMKVPAGTPSGRSMRLKGRGIKKARTSDDRGDLFVTIEVVVPQRVDGAVREAVEAFAAATVDEDPREGLTERAKR
ncbi:MAG: DnaJ C-terminal domain-containing protein, partial [Janthinobacterium lividum]